MQRSTPPNEPLAPEAFGDHLIEEVADKLQEANAYFVHMLEQLDLHSMNGEERVILMRKHTGLQNALHALRHLDV
jgi:hypothetical protein